MLDFTKNVLLPPHWRKKYLFARLGLLFLFFILAIFTVYRAFFPSSFFDYTFSLSSTSRNTISNPRTLSDVTLKNDPLPENGALKFDTNVVGNFSDATFSLTLKSKSAALQKGSVSVQRSYQAFLYPQAQPLGFKSGTLLNADSDYYLVSQNKLRHFPSWETAQSMGFEKNMFQNVTAADLQYNEKGAEIIAQQYPADMLFLIGEDYYQLKNNELLKFATERAYFTNYPKKFALAKDTTFLQKYALSDEILGFAEGTLFSSPQAVFAVSDGKSLPFDNTATFEALGYNWNDVISATSDELGIQPKGKLISAQIPHPNGTIFLDQATTKYFLVQNGATRELPTPAIRQNYLHTQPILATSAQEKITPDCQLQKKFWPFGTYSCTLDISALTKNIGNDYQFTAQLGAGVNLKDMHVVLSKTFETKNFKNSLSLIKQQLLLNYTQK